jgi:hypothetical protein
LIAPCREKHFGPLTLRQPDYPCERPPNPHDLAMGRERVSIEVRFPAVGLPIVVFHTALPTKPREDPSPRTAGG